MTQQNVIFLQAMTEEDGAEICTWCYPEPYHIYNWPSWEQLQQEEIEFGDDQIRSQQYLSIYNHANSLIGFTQFFPLSNTIRLGIFLAPKHCDRGLGAMVTRLAIQEARARYPQHELDLEVETWNVRAVKVYEKVGFQITDTYVLPRGSSYKEVHCMELPHFD